MIGKLLRLAYTLVAVLAVGTLLAELTVGAYCWKQGAFERARLEQVLAIIQGRAPPSAAQAVKKNDDLAKAVSLVDLARARAIARRDFELREQSLHNRVEQFQLERIKLADETNRYNLLKTSFERQLDELRAATISDTAETTRLILENMKPKQAKEQILHMVDQGSMKEVVALISAMSPTKRSKVLGEFRTAEESNRLADILKLIRTGEPNLTLIDDAQKQLDGKTRP